MVNIGDVETFARVSSGKDGVMKVAEEEHEVYSAWEAWRDGKDGPDAARLWADLTDECADLIQATCNLIAALGIEDFTPYMDACYERNHRRGRYVLPVDSDPGGPVE